MVTLAHFYSTSKMAARMLMNSYISSYLHLLYSPQGPYWPLSVGGRNSVWYDGNHYRNPTFVYKYNVLDAGFTML